MKLALIIGIGSFIGGFSRYLLSLLIQAKTASPFPLHTLIINIIGCFFIGIVFGFFDKGQISQEWKLFFATGILGGFTTFSAFSIETLTLFREGYVGYALVYIFSSVFLGLLLTYLAYSIVKHFLY
ncbi:MAG: fluoride efflux transporter CrcB [Fibromonadaceae bacterium]|jgi:CrcB protein|nr:fluoride efflux transporter CrcB [Fibromonadaceae bacterium]